MCHQDVTVTRRQLGQGGGHHRPLLLTQHVGDRGLALLGVHQQVRPTAGPVVLLGHRRDQVACRHRGVVRQLVRLDPRTGRHHAHQGLLHEVVHGVRVFDARSDDAPEHGHEVDERVVVVRAVAGRQGLGRHARVSSFKAPHPSGARPGM